MQEPVDDDDNDNDGPPAIVRLPAAANVDGSTGNGDAATAVPTGNRGSAIPQHISEPICSLMISYHIISYHII
jgi:hypothetical protein